MENVLKSDNLIKVYLKYTDNSGFKKKELVTVRYMDTQLCYFAAEIPITFSKPKSKIDAEVVAYTPEGVYISKVKLLGATMSMSEVLYEVTIPTLWEFKQLRAGARKRINLPIFIQYDDGYSIEINSFDLSIGGVAFNTTERISAVYQRLKCKLVLQLPSDLIINFPDGNFVTDAIFVRTKESDFNEKRYAYKFLNISQNDAMVLKNYLLKVL